MQIPYILEMSGLQVNKMLNSLLLASALNTTLIFSGQAIDQVSTEVALNRCPACSESNPLMQKPVVVYPARIAFALLGTAIAGELEKEGHKKAARIFSISLFIIPSVIAIHNMRVSK